MRLFVDLDQHAAVQDFAIAAPAPPPQFKSQDTIDFLIYFLQAGIVQDMGAGFALKFGMIKTGDASNTILAYQTASTYLTDPNGNPYYQMQVVMNTSQMATAIGTSPSIACTIELRYQDALAEIIHTLNLAATVFQTILVETGVTPPGVSTGYPDASTIELLVHKNVANGYAGLDALGDISASVIPVDGQTIVVNSNGDIASAAILAYTAANFTTPASGGTVTVTFVSTANLIATSYVRIPIAGYYIVQSVTNSTTAVLQNNGDPFNAISGTTITSGAVLLPAQAAAGGGGGTAGQSAYTNLTAGFTVPAVGATVAITVGSTAWMGGSGYGMFITGAGYYLVSSITDATHLVVTNSGSAANQPTGTSVPSGGTVSAAGPMGPAGAQGTGFSAYDALTAAFTQPAMNGTVAISISNTAWLSANQIIYVATGGYYQVTTVVNATTLNVANLPYPGNASAGATIASGSKVSPAGLIGPQGAGGPGLNSFTTLSANFTQPAVTASVTVNVGTTAWMAQGQGIFIQGGGYYTVASVSDLTHAVVTNVGGSANTAPGSTITGSGTQTVSPAGIPGTLGVNAYTVTTSNFTTPAAGSSATIIVGNTAWIANGQNIFIAGAGYYQVAAIISATQLSVTNLGANYGNTAGGTTINSGAQMTPAGVIGPAGPAGTGGGGGGGSLSDASTTGLSWIANPAGILKRVVAGSTNVTVTDSGAGYISIDAPSATGGGGMIARSTGIELFDDFTGATQAGQLNWFLNQDAGSGATIGLLSNQSSTAPEIGIFQLISQSTGTTALARYSLGPATVGWTIGGTRQGALIVEWRVAKPSLETVSNYAEWRFGFMGGNPVSTWHGAWFSYNVNVSPNWQCNTSDGGSVTTADSGVAITAAVYRKLSITMNAGWTSATFAVDGTTVATITSTLPGSTGTIGFSPVATVGLKAGSSSVPIFLDWFYMKYSATR